MSVCLSFFVSVCLSVQYFSQKWVIFSFWFFCAMLDNWNIKKQTEICFSRKIQFCPGLGKRAKIGFFDFWKNIVTDISPPIPYSAKLWLWSYGPKCYWPIKFQDSLKCNISRKKLPLKFPSALPNCQFLQREICIFSNVCQQIIAKADLSLQHSC